MWVKLKLEARAEKLQGDAMMFQQFVKSINERTMNAKKEVTVEAKKHQEAVRVDFWPSSIILFYNSFFQ